jgi:hypothetical protein
MDQEQRMNAIVDLTPADPTERRLTATTPAALLQIALESGADLDRLERLMVMQERWEKNQAERAYNEAFSAFKSEAVSIIKNKTVSDGPLKNKKYAELFAVVNAVTPALSKHGLSASWRVTKDEKDWLEVTCTLKHVGGHCESVSMGGPPDAGGAKNAIQARASTVSYLERYTLKAITGLSEQEDDNDGGGADLSGRVGELCAQLRLTKTDAEALALWRERGPELQADKNGYAEFKAQVLAHRRELKEAA